MNKMQMAHEYALKQMESLSENSTMQSLVSVAWQYADAMQAEADEREKELKHNHLKTYADAYMNCEIQVTDPDGNCRITTRQKELDRKEWQPDWSQAPEWAKAWTINRHGEGIFWSEIPTAGHDGYFLKHENYKLKQGLCYLFGYTGNWQDSLRKRPQ